MITGNKGEWSEIYALLKLLGDKQLLVGDADLNRIETLLYPIIKIIRAEQVGQVEYELNEDLVIISGETVEELRFPVSTFSTKAAELLDRIRNSTGASFSIPEVEDFMTSMYCRTLKANSNSKTDIRIVVHDPKINRGTELGFSIKSKLGGEASLLNAGKTTNFIYQIVNFEPTTQDINRINEIETRSKIKDRIEAIQSNGGNLKFSTLEQPIFKNNLVLIDSALPEIISEIIKLFFTSNLSSIKDLTQRISAINPLHYDTQFNHSFYEYKIKRFLTDVALGMMPSRVWAGVYDATGGYLIVKEDGDVLCYHIYNRNQFEDYLFANTKLETASSTRHEFGKIYEVNEHFYFKLNLQIRFR